MSPSTAVERVLSRLKRVKQTGNSWTALCPAHEDSNPSLTLSQGDDGRALLKCHAGCSQEDVIAALGLTKADLFVTTEGKRIAATYDYRDAGGVLRYQVVRNEPKEFRQRRPDGRGGWIWSMAGVERIPYNLSAVIKKAQHGGVVFCVEGEKDADRLNALGFVATTNSGGAGKWDATQARHLLGAKIVILPDNDEPGAKHADHLARLCYELGARWVKVVPLPGLTTKGADISDWLDAQPSLERAAIDDRLAALLKAVPFWEPPAQAAAAPDSPKAGVLLSTFADVKPEPVSWLWPGYVPYGKLTVLEGDPGLGKSTLTTAIAAAVSRGRGDWLPTGGALTPADVVFITYEDGLADTLVPRFLVTGGDASRVHCIRGIVRADGTPDLVTLPDHLPQLREVIAVRHVSLVVIDPLMAALSGTTDSYKDQDVRRALAPIAQCAEDTGAAVIVVRHLVKSGGRRAITAGGGSQGIGGAARSVLAVGPSEEDPTRCVLAVVKCNVAKKAASLLYSLETAADGNAPIVRWHGTTMATADDLAAARSDISGDRGNPGKLDEAKAFLPEWLSSGPLDRHEVMRLAKAQGISESTVERAARSLELVMRREGFGVKQRSTWTLPYTRFTHSPSVDEASVDEASGLHARSLDGTSAYNAENRATGLTRFTSPIHKAAEASGVNPTGTESVVAGNGNMRGRVVEHL